MEKALEGEPEIALKPPKGVTGVYIDPASGYTSGPGCAAKHYTYFIAGTEPADVCYGPEPSKKKRNTSPLVKKLRAKSGGISGSAKKTEPGALRAGLNPRLPQAPMGARVKSRDG